MKRAFKWVSIIGLGLVVVLAFTTYCISFVYPVYDWDLRLPSPDGRYDLVVLRGDMAAFDSFTYHLYIFPHALVPPDRPKGTRVWLTSIWRGKKHLIYSGYNYPAFRWTDVRSIKIDLHELYTQEFVFNPVKRFTGLDEAILVSLAFDAEDNADTLP